MLDSVIRVNKKYYPQTLLEECKYVIRKNEMEKLINDYLDLMSSDESDNRVRVIIRVIMNLIVRLIINLIMMNLVIRF